MSSLLLGLLLASPAHAEELLVDRIAAIVNDDVITLSEIYDIGSEFITRSCPPPATETCTEEMEHNVLDALVRESLIRQELIRMGYEVRPEDVDMSIDQVVKEYQFPDRGALRQEVERSGTSWEDYRTKLADDLRIQRFQAFVLRPRVNITDDEIRDRYQRKVRGMAAPMVARLSAFGFMLPADVTPDERVQFVTEFRRLFETARDGGRSWESLVEEYDTAGLSRAFAAQSFKESDLNEPLARAAFDTDIGQIAEPVMVDNVIYGIRVEGRRELELEPPTLESLETELTNEIFREKLADAEAVWYLGAKRQAAIKILLPGGPEEEETEDAEETAPADDVEPESDESP